MVFLATFLYAIAFVGGLGVPTGLDSEAGSPIEFAVTIDLLAEFGPIEPDGLESQHR